MLKELIDDLRELAENLSHYASAKSDSVKLSLRTVVVRVALTAVGCLAAGALFVMACWFLLTGAAAGLSILFGDRVWLGNIATGLLLMAGLGLGIYVTASCRNSPRKRTVEKYERLQARQQTEFGRTARDQAASASQEK